MTVEALSSPAPDAEWLTASLTLLKRGGDAILVVISDVKGSAPRGAGTVMLVTEERAIGTIGGGALEHDAMKAARLALRGADVFWSTSTALGPSLDQCCGGRVGLAFRRLTNGDLPLLRDLRAEGGALLIRQDAALVLTHRTHDKVRQEDLLLLASADLHPVAIYGAGHVGQALINALAPLPFTVTWIDDRADVFPTRLPENVTPLSSALPEAAALTLPPGAFHIVVTHSHAVDLEIVSAILGQGAFGFLGLIGSKTKRARFLSMLAERGHDEHVITRLTSPIGVGGITDKRPEVIAASVAAQLLQHLEAAP